MWFIVRSVCVVGTALLYGRIYFSSKCARINDGRRPPLVVFLLLLFFFMNDGGTDDHHDDQDIMIMFKAPSGPSLLLE